MKELHESVMNAQRVLLFSRKTCPFMIENEGSEEESTIYYKRLNYSRERYRRSRAAAGVEELDLEYVDDETILATKISDKALLVIAESKVNRLLQRAMYKRAEAAHALEVLGTT